MGYKDPPRDKSWKPGQSGNESGRPKGLLTSDQIKAILRDLLKLNRQELQDVISDPKTNMIKLTIASVIAKAAKDGDYSRLEFLLNRGIGKVKDELVVTDDPNSELKKMSLPQLLKLVNNKEGPK